MATRHILSTDFRTDFIPVIDMLAQERIILGTGTTAIQNLRCVARPPPCATGSPGSLLTPYWLAKQCGRPRRLGRWPTRCWLTSSTTFASSSPCRS